jgi:hypothetical protein
VDGIIVVATVSVVALAGRRGVWYPWVLLVGGATVSVTANAIQAGLSKTVTVPHAMAAAVAAVPPIVLLAITHLTVVLTKPGPEPPPSGSGPDLTLAPEQPPARAAKEPDSQPALPALMPAPPGPPVSPGNSQTPAPTRPPVGVGSSRTSGPAGPAHMADGSARASSPAPAGSQPWPTAGSGPFASRVVVAPPAEPPFSAEGTQASAPPGNGDPVSASAPPAGQSSRVSAGSPLSIYALAPEPAHTADVGADSHLGDGGAGEGSRTWLVEQAKAMRAEGMTYRAIGRTLGRNGTTIARWLNEDQSTTSPGGNDGTRR